MPFDSATFQPPIRFNEAPAKAELSPWTTHAELTADQRARFGDSILSRDEVRADAAYRKAQRELALSALKLAGDDKLKALSLMLGGSK